MVPKQNKKLIQDAFQTWALLRPYSCTLFPILTSEYTCFYKCLLQTVLHDKWYLLIHFYFDHFTDMNIHLIDSNIKEVAIKSATYCTVWMLKSSSSNTTVYYTTWHFRVQITTKTSANMRAYCTRWEPVWPVFINWLFHRRFVFSLYLSSSLLYDNTYNLNRSEYTQETIQMFWYPPVKIWQFTHTDAWVHSQSCQLHSWMLLWSLDDSFSS